MEAAGVISGSGGSSGKFVWTDTVSDPGVGEVPK